MRIWHLALVAAICTLVFASACAAQERWRFVLGPLDPLTVGSRLVIGVSPDALDSYDAADRPAWTGWENLSLYHSAVEGWLGPEGFYWQDIRAPIVGEKTWADIYLWWTGNEPWSNWLLVSGPLYGEAPPSYYRFTLYLDRVPAGITYDGPWRWELSPTTTTEIPSGTFTPYASETGLDGYRFHLTVVVPEPGSLLALAGGLVVLGSMRRKLRRNRS